MHISNPPRLLSPPSVLSAILATGSVCLILVACVVPLLPTVALFSPGRGFVLVRSGYFLVECVNLELILSWKSQARANL